MAPARFVYCIQNHDQVGNRALGERLNHDIGLDAYRAASALLLLSPYTPLLFMGQEWAATTPFLFFTHHHGELGRLVTEGWRAEFAGFSSFAGSNVPDPQAPDTFARSKLRWEERELPPHAGVLLLYRNLLQLRRLLPPLGRREELAVSAVGDHGLLLRREGPGGKGPLLLVVNLRGELDLAPGDWPPEAKLPADSRWTLLLDSEAPMYGGTGGARLASGHPPRLVMAGPGAVVFVAADA